MSIDVLSIPGYVGLRGFSKIGIPLNHPNRMFHYKPSILFDMFFSSCTPQGCRQFWDPSFCSWRRFAQYQCECGGVRRRKPSQRHMRLSKSFFTKSRYLFSHVISPAVCQTSLNLRLHPWYVWVHVPSLPTCKLARTPRKTSRREFNKKPKHGNVKIWEPHESFFGVYGVYSY